MEIASAGEGNLLASAFVTATMRPDADPSGPTVPSWVHPKVVRGAARDMYSTVLAAQSRVPTLAVPDLGDAYAETLIAAIGSLVERLTTAISTNALRLTADVGATVEAVVDADGPDG